MADLEAKEMEEQTPDPDATPRRLEPAVSITDQSQLTAEMEDLDQDPYDEDQAELRYLHSKPTCFIVFGKPGSGKTALARRLAQEWKCEMISATDIIQQNIDLQTEMGVKAQEILLRGEAVPEEMAAKMLEDKINSPEVAHHGYILDGFPSLNEDYMSVKDQLELVKNWKLKPDFIVNLKLPDKDLEVRRVGQRVDPLTGEMYTKDMYDPDRPLQQIEDLGEGEGEEEEEEDEEEETPEEEGEFPELAPEVLERLVKRPEDIPSHVQDNIRQYKSNMLRILEDYMADHDQQYLIELDSNKLVTVLFKELMARLSCFVLRPAAVPIRLHDPDDEELPDDIDTDELMRTMAAKEMVAPRFRWRRSRWLRNCPVALAEGNITQGKPEFTVSFLDKLYFLSSGEAMEKFLKNPRPYLMPPQPRPPCKLVVTGPPLSGKTVISHQMAFKYGAMVLNMDELIKPRMEEEKKKLLEQTREEAVENAITAVRTKLQDERDALRIKEEQAASEAEETAAETEAEAEIDNPEDKDEEEEATETDETKTEGKTETDGEGEKTSEEPEEQKDGDETATEAAEGEKATIPATEMTEPSVLVDAEHPEVKAMVEAAVKAVDEAPVNMAPEIYIEVLEQAIQEAEGEGRRKNPDDGPLNGGWVLDNFPATRDQWNAMIEKGILPDEIICLRDDSDNGDFLVKRWYHMNKAEVDVKMQVRKDAEEKERLRKKKKVPTATLR